MLTVIVQSKYCYEFLKCIGAVMTMVCCFGCFNKSESGWSNCAEKTKRLVCFNVCVCKTFSKSNWDREMWGTFPQVIIFRLRVAVRGQVAVIVGFYSTANLRIISNLHSTGNVINYTVKTILWVVSKHGHWFGTLLAFVRPFDTNYIHFFTLNDNT